MTLQKRLSSKAAGENDFLKHIQNRVYAIHLNKHFTVIVDLKRLQIM